MMRVWRWLASLETGTALLLLTALWLALGSATMRAVPEAFRPLMRLYLAEWLASVGDRPWLWWWMVPLFLTAALLGLSTAACTVEYLVAVPSLPPRRLGVALFHVCVLCFLMGHLRMEFGGLHEIVALQLGRPVPVPGTDVSLTLTGVDALPVSSLPGAPVRRRLVLEVMEGAVVEWRSAAVLAPARALGLDLHVPMFGAAPPGTDAVVEVRRNPGLAWFLTGCLVLVLGCLLAAPAVLVRVREELVRKGPDV